MEVQGLVSGWSTGLGALGVLVEDGAIDGGL